MRYIRATFRFAFFFFATAALYGIWFIGSLLIPNKQFWREFIFAAWAQMYVGVSGMRIEIIGKPPPRPFFLVSNHLSYSDIPLIRSVVNGVFVAKGEIQNWFFAGRIVRDMGNIFVNRQNRRDIPRAGEEVLEALERGEGVVIFPEGTSSKGEGVLPFKSSFLEFAAKTDLAVHYVSISYKTNADELPASIAIAWWDDTQTLYHLWRHFQVKRFDAIMKFGELPLVNPDRKQLAQSLWEKVQEGFFPVV